MRATTLQTTGNQRERKIPLTRHQNITRNSSGDEIANVNFFTTTSCTYYKIQ